MKDKKILHLIFIFMLVTLLLCTMLVACSKKKETAKSDDDGIKDDYKVVETDLDVEEIKDATKPIVEIFTDTVYQSSRWIYSSELMYYEIYYENDEAWEYSVRQLEKAGVTMDQFRNFALKSEKVINDIIEISGNVQSQNQGGSGSIAETIKAGIDQGVVADLSELFDYIKTNLHAQQFEEIQNLFSYCVIYEPVDEFSYESYGSPFINYTVEEIESVYQSSAYADVYDRYYNTDFALYPVYDSIAEILTSKDAMYLMNGILTTVFDLGGATDAEIKEVADMIVDVIAGQGEYNGRQVEGFTYVLTHYSVDSIKSFIDIVADVIDDCTDNEKLNKAFSTVMTSLLTQYEVGNYVSLFSLGKDLPIAADMLKAISKDQISLAKDAITEAFYGDNDNYETEIGRALAVMLEVSKPYFDKLSDDGKQSFLRLFGTLSLEDMMSLYSKPASQMTDAECEQLYYDIEEVMSFDHYLSKDREVLVLIYDLSTVFIPLGTSDSDAMAQLSAAYEYYDLTTYTGLDTSTTGLKYLETKEVGDYGETTTQKFTYFVYDDNYIREHVYPVDRDAEICRIDLKKGSYVDENVLLTKASQLYFSVYLYCDELVEQYKSTEIFQTYIRFYDDDLFIKNITMPDTSKAGLQAGVITFYGGIFGDIEVPCLFNIYEEDVRYNEYLYTSGYVLQGEQPEIEYRYTSLENGYTSELIPSSEISGYDPYKTGVQLLTINHNGKTYKKAIAVITYGELQKSMWISRPDRNYYRYYNGDTIEDFILQVSASTYVSRDYFYTYRELKDYVESYGLSVDWDIDLTLYNVDQQTTIKVKDAYGNIINSVTFTYAIRK